jgi:glycerol-3-phosphate dehydrogenase (NAD(P)+)
MYPLENKLNIGILGSGSWGTALAKIITSNGHTIKWWIRDPKSLAHLNEYYHNPKYLSSVSFSPGTFEAHPETPEVISSSEYIILAVPSAFLEESLSTLPDNAFEGKKVYSAIKGIVPNHNKIVADYLKDNFGVSPGNFGVITGPCHAEEVAMEKLSYLTIASENEASNIAFSKALSCRFIKTVLSDDIYGTEYSAVLKNIVAIASGICHGLGYGDNFQAVLISSALREIKRFVDAVHPINRDINDSAYLGDLLVTAYSQFSRNRMFGNMIGKGYSVKMAQLEMDMIAEGYYASRCIYEINKKFKVDMPIADAVYRIIYEKIAPAIEIKLLTDKLA